MIQLIILDYNYSCVTAPYPWPNHTKHVTWFKIKATKISMEERNYLLTLWKGIIWRVWSLYKGADYWFVFIVYLAVAISKNIIQWTSWNTNQIWYHKLGDWKQNFIQWFWLMI